MLIRLRANIPEIFFGALLAVAIFAMGILFGSSQPAPSSQQHQTENSAAKSQPPQQHSPNLWGHSDPGVTAATVLLFLVGIAQAIMFYFQLRYMRVGVQDASDAAKAATRQAKVAEDTIVKIERPYVFISNVSSLKVDTWWDMDASEEGHRIFVTYSVVNFGKIPAVIEDMQASLSVFTEPLSPANTDYDHPLANSSVLVPGEPRNELDEGLVWSEFTGDESGQSVPYFGKETVFFWVIVRYRGLFSKGHVTRACWRYDERTRRFTEFNGGPEHNSQT